MNREVFDACMDYHRNKSENVTWSSLAKMFGYLSAEALRSSFKRERKKLAQQKNEDKKYYNIVCFDIEISPMLLYSFSLYNDMISPDNIVRDRIIIAWSGKAMNDSHVYGDVLTSDEAIANNDERIVKSLWNFLNGFDILMGHNIIDFDIKHANTRFLYHGLPPLSSFQTIDTLKVSRMKLAFESNQLKYINRKLGIKQKIETSGMRLWIDCMNGDEKSLMEMLDYCKGDSVAVEELYYKLRPYITGHPNLGLMIDSDKSVCPNCGSDDIMSNGYYYTSSGKFESMRCSGCGALSRKRNSILDKNKKKNLLRN